MESPWDLNMNKSSLIFYKQVIPFGMVQSIFYTFLN
jgi:hypothetical protein